MKPQHKKRTLGFSLVEVLLAMIIVSIALLGILALQTASVRSAAGSRGRETAVYLCQALSDSVQSEAQRLSLVSGYSIPGAGTAVTTYFATGAAATTSGTQYFDVNGNSTTSANKVFTVDWSRLAPRDGTPNCFEFVTTATWSFETNASNAPVVRTVQINRLVRID
jgi:type IV pilus modification protein PilV